MKFFIKKIYIILLLIILLTASKSFSKDSKIQYTRENISNYFLGMVSANRDYNNEAFKYLKKVRSIKNTHSQFNVQYIRTLVSLDKFDEAFTFSKSVWTEEEFFFETDLLLGLNYFLKKDYTNAEKYFKRLNKISQYNLIFDNFIGNVLLAWNNAAQKNKEESFKYINKIPRPYRHLKSTQNIFLECYFDIDQTQQSLEKLIKEKDYNFSRYNYFLINYLIYKNKTAESRKIIQNSSEENASNLLIKQTKDFFYHRLKSKFYNFFIISMGDSYEVIYITANHENFKTLHYTCQSDTGRKKLLSKALMYKIINDLEENQQFLLGVKNDVSGVDFFKSNFANQEVKFSSIIFPISIKARFIQSLNKNY